MMRRTQKTISLPIKKSIFMTKIFLSQIKLKKNFFKIGKLNWLKMQNMTQCDALITKNYISALKNNFLTWKFFRQKL